MSISKRARRIIIWASASLVVLALVAGFLFVNSILPIITGYSAKHLCSSIFISNRTQQSVEDLDLSFFPVSLASSTVSYADSTVTSRFLWGKSVAVFRSGLGATLVRDCSIDAVRRFSFSNRVGYDADATPWPLGNVMPDSLKMYRNASLENIAHEVVAGRAYGGHSFAFVILKDGVPVVEAYRSGFNRMSKLLGWSMAKSVVNAVVGVMAGDGMANVFAPTGIKEWQGDARRLITVDDLLRMRSGLQWNEDYGARSDVTQMLYCHGDAARFSISKQLAFPTAKPWYYSSGSTNIACFWARQRFASDSAFYRYMYARLFNRIGMGGAIFEPDASGVPVGSSYIYATALDYVRFALLYLNDGVFAGQRVLPKGWVRYTLTPTDGSQGAYGAGFWMKGPESSPELPNDFFSCEGHDGQYIMAVPSKRLAVVVLGFSHRPDNTLLIGRLVRDVANAVDGREGFKR